MSSRWTPNELVRIKGFYPEFKALGVRPSLDSIIVAFLQKYEVYIRPASTSDRRSGGEIASDALLGAMSGATGDHELMADAAIIGNQKKGAAIQEWTQWKQWALNHKDFEVFRAEVMQNWEKLSERLESDEFAEEWNAKDQALKEEVKARQKITNDDLLKIALPVLIGSLALSTFLFLIGNGRKELFNPQPNRSLGLAEIIPS